MTQPRKRRPRDPDATREAILVAARSLLAKDGPEALSLSEVAQRAGVNRGTAYQHFATREKLVQATVEWVSDNLFRAAFGDPATIGERRVEEVDVAAMTDRLADYAMDNPELCRIWLQHVLSLPDPAQDAFWREYEGSLRRFAATDLAQPGIDAEVLAVMMLSGVFFWPVWARAHAEDPAARSALAQRFTRETLRLSLFGSMKREAYPALAASLSAVSRPR